MAQVRLAPIALSTVMLAAAAVAAPQAQSAPTPATDGAWVDASGRTDVRVRVEGGRVVAARGTVPTRPANDSVAAADCEPFTFAFAGPLEPGDVSDRRRFAIAQGPYFSIAGRLRSATRITGTLTKRPEGARSLCEGRVRFVLSPA